MAPKDKLQKAIDRQPRVKGNLSVSTNPTDNIVPPGNPTVGAPTGLALATAIGYSSAAPTAVIDATWVRPINATPDNYQIQVSTNSTFTAVGTITAVTQRGGIASAHIDGLLPGVLHYVRVRANVPGVATDWSATASIVTATDTVAAGVPTSPAATWVGTGDLLITWVNPTDANFKDVKIVVRASSGGTIYRTWYSAAQHWLYTAAMDFTDSLGVGDFSLYVEMQSRTFSNVLGSIVNTGLVTKGVPNTPSGLTQSWSGDTPGAGVAGPDLTVAWNAQNDAAAFQLAFDGVTRRADVNRYTYTLDANRAEHAGTPDPVVAYSLVAVDVFNQTSIAVSGTATNTAPAAPTATLTEGAVSGVQANVTSTPVADFWRYEYVFKRDGTTVATVLSSGSSYTYPMQGAGDGGFHSWTVVIRQEDVFAQFSSTVTPAAVAFEGLTLSYLRDDIVYSDSIGTSASVLKTALADDDSSAGGITYNP